MNIKLSSLRAVRNTPGIYAIWCAATMKLYVGQTNNLKSRLRYHRNSLIRGSHDNRYLQQAYNKYGPENFIFDIIIDQCELQDLDNWENFYIVVTQAGRRSHGFNLVVPSSTASSARKTYTSEVREKMSNCKKGKALSKQHRDRIREAGLARSEQILAFGQQRPLRDWASEKNIRPNLLRRRISSGMTLEQALTKPVSKTRTLTYEGITLTVAEWADRLGVRPGLINKRLRSGWSIKEALTLPLFEFGCHSPRHPSQGSTHV